MVVQIFSQVQSTRSIQSPFWPAGGSPARDRRTAVLFPIEWNRRNKSADLEKKSTAHYKVMQKLVKSAVFLYIFCEKKVQFSTHFLYSANSCHFTQQKHEYFVRKCQSLPFASFSRHLGSTISLQKSRLTRRTAGG